MGDSGFYEPRAAGEKFLHHGFFECPGFIAADFEGGEFGVHIGEDGGDSGLFGERRPGKW